MSSKTSSHCVSQKNVLARGANVMSSNYVRSSHSSSIRTNWKYKNSPRTYRRVHSQRGSQSLSKALSLRRLVPETELRSWVSYEHAPSMPKESLEPSLTSSSTLTRLTNEKVKRRLWNLQTRKWNKYWSFHAIPTCKTKSPTRLRPRFSAWFGRKRPLQCNSSAV